MNSTKLWMTTPSTGFAGQSCFGMPMSSHAFGAGTTAVVREHVTDVAGIKGAAKTDRVRTQSYLPGNSAWRPPTC